MAPLLSSPMSLSSSGSSDSASPTGADGKRLVLAAFAATHHLPSLTATLEDNSNNHNNNKTNGRSQSDSALVPPLLGMAGQKRDANSNSDNEDGDDNDDDDDGGAFIKPQRRISFNERVSVREFDSGSWHPIQDLEQLSPIRGNSSPGGRGMIAVPKIIVCPTRGDNGEYDDHLYLPQYHPHSSTTTESILRTSSDGSNMSNITSNSHSHTHSNSNRPYYSMQYMLQREIRRILMVDPHDIFLTLFSKRLQDALPHVNIVTAHSSEEALQLVRQQQQQYPFDIVITEERLSIFHRHRSSSISSIDDCGSKLTSGSALLGHLKEHYSHQYRQGLLIGVSAHWQSDHATMVQSGADYCWSKAPPPTLHKNLLEELLHTLLLKRGKHDLAKALMLASSVDDEEELPPTRSSLKQ